MTSRNVALVTAREAEALDTDLPFLRSALERAGLRHATVAWDDQKAPWNDFDLAVVRSAWDYVGRRDEFVAWARAIPCPLRNPAGVLAWNTDKRYLAELEANGIAIVPTQWGAADGSATWNGSFGDAAEFVVKPAISAGAKDTLRYTKNQHAEAKRHVERIIGSGGTAMIQPYMPSVDRRGETGMLFFGGEFSHAIMKGPILRGARNEVGGLFAEERVEARTPSATERAFAERVLGAIPFPTPLYARIDVVEDESGNPRLLELELTEPSVFLDRDAGAADRFATAIAREL
jgi:O-ureido-D-serine cyclo-ligase